MMLNRSALLLSAAALAACQGSTPNPPVASDSTAAAPTIEQRLAKYTTVRLTSDLVPTLTANQRRMIPLLIDAAREMDPIFWEQTYGSRDSLMANIDNPDVARFAEINYGPWDRLAEDEPFIAGTPTKQPGADFYPHDMTKEEFEQEVAEGGPRADSLRSLYTLVRRDAAGRLITVPYSIAFRPSLERAAAKLREAAALAEDPGFERYLRLRADALLDDEFRASDLAWMDMKNNTLDIVIGPIETYEDALFGYKAANEAYVLIKDLEWSKRLAHYVELLPWLQQNLPVAEEYRRETPGTGSDLNAYDAVYYAGQANSGAKTIAINLPNDETVQLEKGTRRLQLKNAMRAKFDKILVPIAGELVVEEQQENITFDAFFQNTMFHEVAHGLGIKNLLNGKGTVRAALKEKAGGLEEEKADVLGLFMVTKLTERGELPDSAILNNYVTFLAGLFRSVRFGASDAHGVANMATFNFFQQMGAFERDEATGKYRVDLPKMKLAVNALSEKILRFQGDGDYTGVAEFMTRQGVVQPALEHDLARLRRGGIPVDIILEQGPEVLLGSN